MREKYEYERQAHCPCCTAANSRVEELTAERNLFRRETVALAKDALQFRAVLKEVSGCHTEHNTPKLCEGCLISIDKALADDAKEGM